MDKLTKIKAQRFSKAMGSEFIKAVFEPIDRNAFLVVFGAPLSVILFYYFFGLPEMDEQLGAVIIGFLSFVGAYIAYICMCLIMAPYRALKKESEKGNWAGASFVYHTPLHLQTVLITGEQDKKWIRINIKDAEPESFVYFKFEYDKGHGFLSIGPAGGDTESNRKAEYGVRLGKKRDAMFQIHCRRDSVPTIARIYVLYWECYS